MQNNSKYQIACEKFVKTFCELIGANVQKIGFCRCLHEKPLDKAVKFHYNIMAYPYVSLNVWTCFF